MTDEVMRSLEGPLDATVVQPDWLDELDLENDLYHSHVLLYRGYDLSAAGAMAWEHEIAPCMLCAPLSTDSDPAAILTDETLPWGRLIHFVCCGNCGTRGPWAGSESQALALWNDAHKRHNLRCI